MVISGSENEPLRLIEISEVEVAISSTEESLEVSSLQDVDIYGSMEIAWADFWESDPVCFQVSSSTGKCYLFKANNAEDKFQPGKKVCFLRVDSGRLTERYGKVTRQFDYLGLFYPSVPNIKLSRQNSVCSKNDEVFKVAQWAIQVIFEGDEVPFGYMIGPASEAPDRLAEDH